VHHTLARVPVQVVNLHLLMHRLKTCATGGQRGAAT
jgi:hypothetical protein